MPTRKRASEVTMGNWAVVACIGVAVGLGACSTTAEFSPHSAAASWSPVAEAAIQVYPADMPLLERAGARIVGYLKVRGDASTTLADCADRASADAAERGGTHFILLDQDSRTSFVSLPGSSTTTTSGSATAFGGRGWASAYGNSTSQTVYAPGAVIQVSSPVAVYGVVCVDPARWTNLPVSLRPAALQED